MDWTRRTLAASDRVRLAVFDGGRADGPTVLFVHGFPDDHHVWDGVADLLAADFRLVSMDVRGAGASDAPADRSGYLLDQLAADIALVAASSSEDPVHLVGHDWGSSQGWYAVTRDGAASRFASYTSISGPDLAMGGAWLRRTWKSDRRAALRQIRKSWYLQAFRLPVLPELMWRSGVGFRSAGRTKTAAGVTNAVHGLNLYRANLARSAAQRPRRCGVRAQVLAPQYDRFVGEAMQTQAPVRWTTSLRTETIEGGHWVLEAHPERVAEPVRAFLA